MSAAAQLAPQMVVTLRKIKHSPSLSEETNAFTAEMYWDGVKVGFTSNHGTGGPNDVAFIDPANRARWNAFIQAQPPVPCEWGDKTPLKMTEDLFIGELVEADLKTKDAIKLEKKFQKLAAKYRDAGYVLLVMTFGPEIIYVSVKPETMEARVAAINAKHSKKIPGVVKVYK